MTISAFELFTIGLGPSSSHTVGPIKSARAFVMSLDDIAGDVRSLRVRLHGSLAWTGKGHGTDKAIVLGLSGLEPETIDPDSIDPLLARVRDERRLDVPGIGPIDFDPESDVVFDYDKELPRHTNGMYFEALDAEGERLRGDEYYSLGGGFFARGDEPESGGQSGDPPYLYESAEGLLELGKKNDMSIAALILENELTWRSRDEIRDRVDTLWQAMDQCIERGLHAEGVLPGRMAVVRRAAKLRKRLEASGGQSALNATEWVNAFAIAVNEENAAGGRVVTSPTNGAAGIIPAVLKYYVTFVPGADQRGIRNFMLVAGAIGILYKIRASISGAEMGCQGEVGVACSMAAGGLAAALGGDNDYIEEAAEIGMEHNLGLTCDPIGGLVQIPCIERNAMGAVKAINAATLAKYGDGTHKVTLDQVIETMRQTGIDMKSSYKETSRGGLAVNVPEC